MTRSSRIICVFLMCLLSTGVLFSPLLWAGDWQMTFQVSVSDPNADSGRLINRLEAGSLSTATDDYDNDADVLALLSGLVQAAFSHEGETTYPAYLQLLWRDVRADGLPKSWRIKVVSQQSSSPVMVEWSAPPSIPSDFCHLGNVSFQDQTTGQFIDPNTTSTYSYASTGTPNIPEIRFFTLTVNSMPQNAPAIPTGLRSRRQRSVIHLQWLGSGDPNVAGYHVWRSLSSGSGYARLATVPATKNKYLDTQVTVGITYYYVVTAVGTNGCESGYSQQSAATAK